MKYLYLITLCLIQFSSSLVFSQPGSLDLSFGGTGKVTTPFFGAGFGLVVAIQQDQKIVAAGIYRDESDLYSFAAIRLLPDGSLDPGFGNGGSIIISPGANAECRSMVIQTNGKIVLAGSLSINSMSTGMVVRLTSHGQLDNTFNGGGIALAGNFDGNCVALQPDQKIVVGGSYNDGTHGSDFGLYRLNANGSRDPSFGSGQGVIIDGGATPERVTGVTVQADGKIVMVGYSDQVNSITTARFNSDGTLDQSFGTGGMMPITMAHGLYINAYGITLQPADGKILVVGDYYSQDQSARELLVVRLNTNGTLDNSFSGNGKKSVHINATTKGEAITVQANGKIIAVGSTQPIPTTYQFVLCRLHVDGSLDANFGNGGIVSTSWPGNFGIASGVAIQGDGRIVVEGEVEFGFGTARYLATGAAPSAAQTMKPDITEAPVFSNIHIYPNPAGNKLQVSGLSQNTSAVLTVMDISGKILLNKIASGRSNDQIDISGLAPGNYFLKITGNKEQQSIPFIKMPSKK